MIERRYNIHVCFRTQTKRRVRTPTKKATSI